MEDTIKQSVCIPIMKPAEMALDVFLRGVRAIGYDGVEIWNREPDFEAVVAATHACGLVMASMCGHAEGLNDSAKHDAIEDELRQSIELAARHSIPGVICFSGARREGLSDEQGLEHCVAGLQRVAGFAEKQGVNLNLELLNSRVDHPGYQADRSDWGVEVCRRVGSPRVRLLYDIYHMQIMEGDIIRRIRAAAPWIAHFHTAGIPGRQDLDDQQELNYGAVVRAIAATGYKGYVGHEFRPRGEVFAALRQAFGICHVAQR